MESICGFIPSSGGGNELKTVHFVYETETNRLKWPKVTPIYVLFLVTRGEGTLNLPNLQSSAICEGDLFLVPPGICYEITGSDDLSYFYISFMGTRATELTEQSNLTLNAPVCHDFSHLIAFWKQGIKRICAQNASLIAESVLLHTFSFLIPIDKSIPAEKKSSVIDQVIDYANHNYADPSLTLKKVASIFGYTEKYLSHLFKQQTRVNWSTYLTRIRIHRATELLENGEHFDAIFAIGPLIMMKYVVETAKPFNVPVTVSMNPVMIDGTGMCGGCRLTLNQNGKKIIRFACVDGPDFNGYEIDFDEAMSRARMYADFERHAYEKSCNLFNNR